jgi:hypothetical protein
MIQAGVDIGYAFRVDADNPAPLWAVGTTYNAGDLVQYQDTYYTSLANFNTGNTPPTPPLTSVWWQQTDSAGGMYLKDNVGGKTFIVNRNTGEVQAAQVISPTVATAGAGLRYAAAGGVGVVWQAAAPINVKDALDRIAAAVALAIGGPIP